MKNKEIFKPGENLLGGFHELDGTIEFYGRINSILKDSDFVLDLGAGRGNWSSDDQCEYRKSIRNIKDKSRKLVGVDIDKVVLDNPNNHENLIIKNGKIPLDDNSIDIIIADWVLEHVQDPLSFSSEVNRVLKPGGIFCARTPHKYKYVSLLARLIKNKYQSNLLKKIQPERNEIDIFPTVYKLNTLKTITSYFKNYKNFSYLYTSHPGYFAGNELLFNFFNYFHKMLPSIFVSEIFVFLRKFKN
tara:strand:- start:1528 stop:2262 length:735 start_codon:yes stop_codon:yes gene_type:complete